jgi:hypothetical protein
VAALIDVMIALTLTFPRDKMLALMKTFSKLPLPLAAFGERTIMSRTLPTKTG